MYGQGMVSIRVGSRVQAMWFAGEEETLTPDQIAGHQRRIDPNHDDVAECAREGCRHPYYRHFDPYEGDVEVGCKYCDCESFVEPVPEPEGVAGRYETLGGDES